MNLEIPKEPKEEPMHLVKASTIETLVSRASKRLPEARTATAEELKRAITASINGAGITFTPLQGKEAWQRVHQVLSHRGGKAAQRKAAS